MTTTSKAALIASDLRLAEHSHFSLRSDKWISASGQSEPESDWVHNFHFDFGSEAVGILILIDASSNLVPNQSKIVSAIRFWLCLTVT